MKITIPGFQNNESIEPVWNSILSKYTANYVNYIAKIDGLRQGNLSETKRRASREKIYFTISQRK